MMNRTTCLSVVLMCAASATFAESAAAQDRPWNTAPSGASAPRTGQPAATGKPSKTAPRSVPKDVARTAPKTAPSEPEPTAAAERDDALEAPLAAFGAFHEVARLGRVWVPDPKHVGESFRPFVTGGNFRLIDGSWRWVSKLPFGDTPFHYGNWTHLDPHGWAWVPGKTFAPAQVVWRLGEPGWDFIGWAPLPPAAARREDGKERLAFAFVPTRRIFSRSLASHVVVERTLGTEVLRHSALFHKTRDASGSLVPTSPSLRDARIRALRRITVGTTAQGDTGFSLHEPRRRGGARQTHCHLTSAKPRTWLCGDE